MNRSDILAEAKEIITKGREEEYGKPENNFALIGRLWGEYLRSSMEDNIRNPEPGEVAIMMALLKIARIASGQVKADNYIDACGYLSLAGELAEAEDD